MECTACGTDNRPGRRFCTHCGSALELACPVCGAPVDPGDRFCGACGSPLSATSTPGAGPPGVAAAERRLVSVMFADLVGFTTLSEHRDPEEVRELLSAYFERCRMLIERYGGTVEKFIGDAVMAVWGTPVAREDDAERAVRSALALTQAVAALGDEVGMPGLRVRAGVLTGSAAVAVHPEGEGMVLGDTVNTASRLQGLAAPGAVLVDDVTRRASEAAIAYDDAGVHVVPGREQPVHAWVALRVVAGVGGARRGAGLEAPFVGRDRELAVVVEAAERSRRERRAELVTVVGDAGAGKSRLLWEFFKHIDGVEELVLWHQGRCLSYGEGVAYWALAEMVRGRAQIVEEEDPASARAKLRAAVERWVPEERERRLVEPRLAHLLGLEQRVAPDRADLFSGWRLFFERMAAEAPVAMVFEDLQWADSGLLEFIDYLLEWSAEHPILILALARPELTEARPGWPTTIVLEPLPEPAMAELLAGLVPGLPDELALRIRERAEGVPLYAVETVRMLLDRGLLAEDGARYVVTGDVTDLAVPETLHALAAARLDGLEAAERALVQDAAVLGQTFTVAGLAALGDLPVGTVRRLLDGLVAKQVLGRVDDPRSPEHGHYAFLQALLRTIAYGTLSRRDRKARHLAAARHLQETSGAETGEIAEVLAAHFLDAARAEPDAPDAPRIRAAARDTLADAGRRAASLALGHEAQLAFDHAAELADDDETRAELLEHAGRAAWLAADAAAARERLDAAIALHEAGGRTQAAALASGVVVEILLWTDRLDEALPLAEHVYASLPEAGAERAAAANQLARMHFLQSHFDQARTAVDAALAIAEPLQAWGTLADALVTRGIVQARLGQPEEGEALVSHGLQLAQRHDMPAVALRAHYNLANAQLQSDRLGLAVEEAQRGVALARARGDRVWEILCMTQAAHPLALLGRWDEVMAIAAEVQRRERFGNLEALAILPSVAGIQAARGDRSGLERTLARAVDIGTTSNSELRLTGVVAQAIAAAALGRPAEALELARSVATGDESVAAEDRKDAFRHAAEAALTLGATDEVQSLVAFVEALPPAAAPPSVRAEAMRFAGLLAAAGGDREEAGRLLEGAAARLRELECRFLLAQVLLEQGELLERDAGRPLVAEARQIFAELGAAPWRERADRALAPVAA